MHLPAKSQFSTDTTWSAPAISNVINALQVISENSLACKNQISTTAENLHLQILSAFQQQEQCLKERKEFVLCQLKSMVDAVDCRKDNSRQEIDQTIVDLEGYLALLQSKGELGVNSEEKLHSWITSILLQASDLCQSYSNQTDCIQFSYNDLKETISGFGELKVNFQETDTPAEIDDDGIAVICDKQWLHCNEAPEAGTDVLITSTENSHAQSTRTDFEENSFWLVNNNKEEAAQKIFIPDSNGSDWLVNPSTSKIEERSSFTSKWLRDSSTIIQTEQPFQALSNQEDNLDRWLSPKSKEIIQENNNNQIKMSLLIDDLYSVSLSDNSKWLQSKHKSNDDDMCQWLTGKSSNQCDSCNASCPFDSFKTDTSTNAKKKWLSTATNW